MDFLPTRPKVFSSLRLQRLFKQYETVALIFLIRVARVSPLGRRGLLEGFSSSLFVVASAYASPPASIDWNAFVFWHAQNGRAYIFEEKRIETGSTNGGYFSWFISFGKILRSIFCTLPTYSLYYFIAKWSL